MAIIFLGILTLRENSGKVKQTSVQMFTEYQMAVQTKRTCYTSGDHKTKFFTNPRRPDIFQKKKGVGHIVNRLFIREHFSLKSMVLAPKKAPMKNAR